MWDAGHTGGHCVQTIPKGHKSGWYAHPATKIFAAAAMHSEARKISMFGILVNIDFYDTLLNSQQNSRKSRSSHSRLHSHLDFFPFCHCDLVCAANRHLILDPTSCLSSNFVQKLIRTIKVALFVLF
jgi:hypothetical protein